MGTEIYRRRPDLMPPYEPLVFTHPDLVEAIHTDYLRAGAEVITTLTLCSNSPQQAYAATALALRCADRRRLVAGALGPGFYSRDVVRAMLDAGAHLLLFETITSTACVARAAEAADGHPAIYCASPTSEGTLISGESLESFVKACESVGADTIGLNCGCGAEALTALLPRLRAATSRPLAAYPAIRPGEDLAAVLKPYMFMLSLAGGCCGTTPADIEALRYS